MGFTLIDKQAELGRMSDALGRERVIALDVECAGGLHHYVNRVCLMQLASRCKIFVVDALAGLDLAPVGRILEDPSVQIVMHDTNFDLRSLDRDWGWRPKNLFDTQIAARLCGHREFGLTALIERHFGIRGSKRFQRADWTVRPLPRDMIEYAAADVRELVRLRDLLAQEIETLGRMEWAREEFALCEGKRFEPDGRPLFARVKRARELCSGRDLAVLEELALARDEIARALDLPLFQVIGDESLIGLAKRPPATIEELRVCRGLHPACRGRYAGMLVAAARKGLKAPELKWPAPRRREKPMGFSPQILEVFKSWRTKYAAQIGVDPDLVLSMDSLRRLASGERIDDVLSREPVRVWRGLEIKQALEDVISGLRRRW